MFEFACCGRHKPDWSSQLHVQWLSHEYRRHLDLESISEHELQRTISLWDELGELYCNCRTGNEVCCEVQQQYASGWKCRHDYRAARRQFWESCSKLRQDRHLEQHQWRLIQCSPKHN